MKVAFISLNQESLPDVVLPIGLLTIQANTPDDHETEFWDLCFERDPKSFLRSRIDKFNPDVLALGLRNIQDNTYSGHSISLAKAKVIIDQLRELSSAPIVLGGSGFSVMPEELMQALKPDFGISGEGEESFPKLLSAIEEKSAEYSGIGNLLYFNGGSVVRNLPSDQPLDLNRLCSPMLDRVDARYFACGGIANVQTKRGCSLRCTYCTYPKIEGRTKRLRSPAGVVDEMISASRFQAGIGHFFIVDSVFNHPPAHALEVCDQMIRREFAIPWTCYINPIGFTRELAERMVEAGCAGIEIGSDSGVDRVLARLRKGFDTRRIRAASRIAKDAGLKDCHTFILGTTSETIDEVHQTLDFIVDLDPYCAILGVWVDDLDALAPEAATERSRFQQTVKDEIMKRRDGFPHWVVPSLKISFDEKYFAFLRNRGVKGPLWQRIRSHFDLV